MFVVCLFSWCYNPLWLYFQSPVVGFSFFVFEVSWSHTMTRHSWTPLDEWSVRCRDLYLTTHDTYNRQTSVLPVGFEPTISAGEWPMTYALDRHIVLIHWINTIILEQLSTFHVFKKEHIMVTKILSRVRCKLTSPKYEEAEFKSAWRRYLRTPILYIKNQRDATWQDVY
jgi:hypothetical protein